MKFDILLNPPSPSSEENQGDLKLNIRGDNITNNDLYGESDEGTRRQNISNKKEYKKQEDKITNNVIYSSNAVDQNAIVNSYYSGQNNHHPETSDFNGLYSETINKKPPNHLAPSNYFLTEIRQFSKIYFLKILVNNAKARPLPPGPGLILFRHF